MKRFQFSLGRVLDFKAQMLDKEKNALAQLRQEQRRVEEEQERCRREFSALSEKMTTRESAGVTILEIRGFQFQLDSIRNEIKQLRAQERVIGAQVEAQLRVVINMSQDVSGLDKLKEKQLDEYNHAVAKADELEIAEFVSGKIIREREA